MNELLACTPFSRDVCWIVVEYYAYDEPKTERKVRYADVMSQLAVAVLSLRTEVSFPGLVFVPARFVCEKCGASRWFAVAEPVSTMRYLSGCGVCWTGRTLSQPIGPGLISTDKEIKLYFFRIRFLNDERAPCVHAVFEGCLLDCLRLLRRTLS